MSTDSWDRTESFLAEFAEDFDGRGQMSGILLDLVHEMRPRWGSVLECHHAIGLNLVFHRRDVPYSRLVISQPSPAAADQWVRVEPRVSAGARATVAVSLRSNCPGPGSDVYGGTIIGGDVCLLGTAPTVLHSFLLQVAEPNG